MAIELVEIINVRVSFDQTGFALLVLLTYYKDFQEAFLDLSYLL